MPALHWEERAFMRRNLLTGLVLAVAAVLVVALSATFDLELESVALLGAALGAVIALVPDRTPVARLIGFAAGFAIAWLGYAARAGLLPDTSSGRAVAVGAVVVLCTAVAVLTQGRLPLWSLLLGTAALAGAYEFTYAAEPPQFMETSYSTATTMLLTVGMGFLAASVIAPLSGSGEPSETTRPRTAAPAKSDRLDEIMEPAQ